MPWQYYQWTADNACNGAGTSICVPELATDSNGSGTAGCQWGESGTAWSGGTGTGNAWRPVLYVAFGIDGTGPVTTRFGNEGVPAFAMGEEQAEPVPARPEAGLVVAERAERAEVLLFSCLPAKERQRFREHQIIEIVGSLGGRYRIRHGRAGNVTRINRSGESIETLCCHPVEVVPDCDTVLTQKLMIETNEAEFRRLANITKNGALVSPAGQPSPLQAAA